MPRLWQDKGISNPRQRAFLAAYAVTGSVMRAAAHARIHRTLEWKWRENSPAFARAFAVAREISVEVLEVEAYRRAHDGVDRPVYQGGRRVGTVREYSDTLLIFLLKGLAPEKYRERFEHSGQINVGFDQLIAALRARQAPADAGDDAAQRLSAPETPPAGPGEADR